MASGDGYIVTAIPEAPVTKNRPLAENADKAIKNPGEAAGQRAASAAQCAGLVGVAARKIDARLLCPVSDTLPDGGGATASRGPDDHPFLDSEC